MPGSELQDWFEENDGVVGVAELSSFLRENENSVRRFARENGLRRIGSTFVFTLDDAEAFLAQAEDEDDEADDDELDEEEE